MLKYTVVYVLISGAKDFYSEQALVSVFSFRLYHPDDNVILLCDKNTYSHLLNDRKDIFNYITSFQIIDIPQNYNNKQKSRWIKTSLKKYVKGDFLFIDCDTVITGKFEEELVSTSSIAAVYDLHTNLQRNLFKNDLIKRCNNIGVDITLEKEYYNSGIMYVKDTPESDTFFDNWHKNWIIGLQNGVDYDQPTFAKTNIEMKHIISKLDDKYNCQIYFNGVSYIYNSKIIHYFSSSTKKENPYIFTNDKYLSEIKKNGIINDTIIYKSIINPKEAFQSHSIIIGEEDFLTLCSPLTSINNKLINKSKKIERFLIIISSTLLKLFNILGL